RLLPRVAPRKLVAGGLLLGAAGLVVLSQLSATSAFAAVVLPSEVLIGLGMGALFPPAFQLAIRGVDRRDAGVASAVINTSTQVGSSIGTAVLNTLAISATASYLAAHGAIAHVAGLVHGYATATAWSAAWLAAIAVVVFVLIDSPHLKED
ncbi:MAG: MFS transporter, partial [Marmoricola sp.]